MGFISQMTEDLEVGPALLMLIREAQELWVSTEGYIYPKEGASRAHASSMIFMLVVQQHSSHLQVNVCLVNISHNLDTLHWIVYCLTLWSWLIWTFPVFCLVLLGGCCWFVWNTVFLKPTLILSSWSSCLHLWSVGNTVTMPDLGWVL